MKKIFTIILLIFCFIKVDAYENNYFKIDIPENYKEENITEKLYKWSDGNKYISIAISNNKDNKYSIETYTEEDINNQKTYIENGINSQLSNYKIKVSVTDIKKKTIDNVYTLYYKIYWPTKETTGYDTYQIGNVFTTNNYIFTITYSSDEDIKENDETYLKVLSSIEIKDDQIKIISPKKYIILIVILGVILAIISVIISHKKKYKY